MSNCKIDITKRHDLDFPIGMKFQNHIQLLSIQEANELRIGLGKAIEWAINMDDLQKEKRKAKEKKDE